MTVNAIGTNYMDFPGFLAASGANDPERRAKIEAQVPVKRLGTMAELAEFTAVSARRAVALPDRAVLLVQRRLERVTASSVNHIGNRVGRPRSLTQAWAVTACEHASPSTVNR